jgi:hypothetical protein
MWNLSVMQLSSLAFKALEGLFRELRNLKMVSLNSVKLS